MKALRLILFGLMLCTAGAAQAQISVSVHMGVPPPWGPVGFNSVQYYYLPDVEAYYDVRSSMFIYFGGGRWIHSAHLPGQYRNYDLYHGYKVVMPDYHGNAPYTHFREHQVKYGKGYHGNYQRTIGERPGDGNPGPGHPRGSPRGNQGGSHENQGGGRDQRGNGHDKGQNQGNGHDHGDGNGKKK